MSYEGVEERVAELKKQEQVINDRITEFLLPIQAEIGLHLFNKKTGIQNVAETLNSKHKYFNDKLYTVERYNDDKELVFSYKDTKSGVEERITYSYDENSFNVIGVIAVCNDGKGNIICEEHKMDSEGNVTRIISMRDVNRSTAMRIFYYPDKSSKYILDDYLSSEELLMKDGNVIKYTITPSPDY